MLYPLFQPTIKSSSFLYKSLRLNHNVSRQFNNFQGKTLAELKFRTVCSQLFLARWGLETFNKQDRSKEDLLSASHQGINRAIVELQLRDQFTPKEVDLMIKPLGEWTGEEIQESSWTWEDFGTLQWVLGLIPNIPKYDIGFDRTQLFRSTQIQPSQPGTIDQFLNQQAFQPQSDDAIRTELARAEIWYWRGQAQQLLNLKSDAEKILSDNDSSEASPDEEYSFSELPLQYQKMINNLPTAIKNTSELALERGLLSSLIKNDFPVTLPSKEEPIAYGDAPEIEVDDLIQYAGTRLHALHYVNGDLEWDDPISRLDENRHTLPLVWQPDDAAQ